MNQDLIITIIGLISGGGLTALIKILFDVLQKRQADHNQNIDDRIIAWQKIQEKTEVRVERLERKLALYEKDFISLENYIKTLELTILRAVPPLRLPEKPPLEREKIAGAP